MDHRALTLRPATHYLEKKDHYSRHDELAGFKLGEGRVYDSADTESFHNLVTHDGAGNKEAAELMMQVNDCRFDIRALFLVA